MVELVDDELLTDCELEFTEPGELTEELDEEDISDMLLVFWPQFDGLAGRTFGLGGNGGGTVGMVVVAGGGATTSTSIAFVKDNRGAGMGFALLLLLAADSTVCCRFIGLRLARIFLNLFAALMFSLFFRKSGNSKFISTPRWSSKRARCALFSPSINSSREERKTIYYYFYCILWED